MSSQVRSVVPVIYVAEQARSQAFYELIGLPVTAEGEGDGWRWALLQSAELSVMLAAGAEPPQPDSGPAVLYVVLAAIDPVLDALKAAGHHVEHLGYPDHAPGGEARVADPDGHGLMLGQPTAVAPAPPPAGSAPAAADERGDETLTEARGGMLRAAAAAVARRGGAAQQCQIGLSGGTGCTADAEVKLADSWGDTAWACITHADEVLVNARGAFIATEDAQGLSQFLRLRRLPRSAAAN
jgi:catechol 2,3-dioxygenase-like lactoylglutathione lyase family enzyme